MRLPDEVDVLVLGFGPAGASAAVAAADAGARVAVVEKSENGGGNCPNSGGFLFDVDGPSAVEHLDALCFGKTDREVLAAFVGGLHEVAPWLHSLGGQTEPVVLEQFNGVLPSWPHFPAPGTSPTASTRRRVASAPAPPCGSCWNRASPVATCPSPPGRPRHRS